MGIQSLGSVTIRVTPERLKTQADEVSRRLRRVRQLFSETENVIARTRNYWIGEAGAAHWQAYINRKDEIEAMLRRLEAHPRNLLQISGNYEAAEALIQGEVRQLRTDVIHF